MSETEVKETEQKIKRLNLVLKTIRNVNQLLVKENDLNRLIQGICNILTENRGYYNAWIAVLDESRRLTAFAEAGIGEEFSSIVERLKRSDLTDCAREALSQPGLVITENPASKCSNCPLSKGYSGRGGITARLEHGEKVYGILTISIPKEVAPDKEEQGLVREIAMDIGFGIDKIYEAKKIRNLEKSLQKKVTDLQERTKELNCLYAISGLVEKHGSSLESILIGTVELIPPAWQYPEATCARIILNGQEFKPHLFKVSRWKLTGDIIVQGKTKGVLEIFYMSEKPEADEEPFLKGERNLANAIAERIGRIIERRQAEDALLESEERFRNVIENSLTGISIIQDGQVVYQNPEQERLFGPLPRITILASMEDIDPDDTNKIKELYQNITSGKLSAFETDFRFYSGGKSFDSRHAVWVNCRASLIEYQGKNAILVNAMDVSRARELENMLRVQDKMSSLGRVAAGIAHEIRNPLSGINIYLNTLEKIYEQPDDLMKVKGILGQLQSASNKIESVIKRVMDFAKPGEPKFISTDINQPIEEAIHLSAVTLRKSGIKIEQRLAKNMPLFQADPNLIEEMVLNLLTNSAEAMKHMDQDKIIEIASSFENKRIVITFSDSGPGIPIDIRKKILDPFYTTKVDGTGIGLSISQRIITDHGGSLEIFNSKWGGAKFRIEFPIKEKHT